MSLSVPQDSASDAFRLYVSQSEVNPINKEESAEFFKSDRSFLNTKCFMTRIKFPVNRVHEKFGVKFCYNKVLFGKE